MRYKTLFRIILKLLGVYGVMFGIISLLGAVASIISLFTTYAATFTGAAGKFTPSIWWHFLGLIAPMTEIAIGFYLFFDGRWVADLAIPSNRFYCPECGYDLNGNTGDRCPECGVDPRVGQRRDA